VLDDAVDALAAGLATGIGRLGVRLGVVSERSRRPAGEPLVTPVDYRYVPDAADFFVEHRGHTTLRPPSGSEPGPVGQVARAYAGGAEGSRTAPGRRWRVTEVTRLSGSSREFTGLSRR